MALGGQKGVSGLGAVLLACGCSKHTSAACVTQLCAGQHDSCRMRCPSTQQHAAAEPVWACPELPGCVGWACCCFCACYRPTGQPL